MALSTFGVKIDDELRARLKAAAEQQGCSAHWLAKQAILSSLDKLEHGENAPDPLTNLDDKVPFLRLAQELQPQTVLQAAITAAYRRPETECIPALLAEATPSEADREKSRKLAETLVKALRAKPTRGLVEGLMQEYALSSQEGVALMCLAEALLRIPDVATRDALIRNKVGKGNWQSHLGGNRSMFVHAATWGLLLTGRLVSTASEATLSSTLTRLVARGGEPMIRGGLNIAMRLMGEQFVLGQTIAEALANSRALEARGFRYSYDMLGEAALTAEDAERYYRDYEQAINAIGKASNGRGIYEGPGISIKLSALHPRYSRAQHDRAIKELLPRLTALVVLARKYDVGINIDAEEADRLELSLELFEKLCFTPELEGWNGIGFVVQAYQKRARFVIDFLIDLARRSRHRLMVRLVKGAYWDAEIKRAQQDGLEGFPVYTRKIHTDVSYLACACRMLAVPDAIFPQFASHNAVTLAAIYSMAGENFYVGQYEFQCLHGMGESLYSEVVGPQKLNRPCRIYAPVGTHETLLPYLVRRLLENGANSSFVKQIADGKTDLAQLLADPLDVAKQVEPLGAPHPKIAAPNALFGEQRANAEGLDLSNEQRLAALAAAALAGLDQDWRAAPMLAHGEGNGSARAVKNPAYLRDHVGEVVEISPDSVGDILQAATDDAPIWQATPPQERAAILKRAADIMENRLTSLIGLIVREAGKTIPAALGEVREAVDFLRYYAQEVAAHFDNSSHRPLGVVVAISPWNFPLAIFTGQIAGALAAGNVVVAKPAEETPLIAAVAVQILHEAGVPRGALQLTPGDGAVGAALVADARVRGVVFTGSTEAARSIQRSLAKRLDPQGRPIPLIAETGGQNAMIVDSSALPEQAVADIIGSGFDSAGQRCSALRILVLQDDIADRLLEMLRGAMRELKIGRPDRLDTDIGPVITAEAQQIITNHIETMREKGYPVYSLELSTDKEDGHFVAPTIIEIPDPSVLQREVFGPVVHVIRCKRKDFGKMIEQINERGYALTFGIHSRIDETIAQASAQIEAGNIYVNRNIIGAVVGVQPFGGHSLSGTGPKAGGPLYLHRLIASQAKLPFNGEFVPEAFTAFVNFVKQDQPHLAESLVQTGEARLYDYKIELPGPVGEQNLYHLLPRGDVLCMATTLDDALIQIGAALAGGNRALVACPAADAWLPKLPASLKNLVVSGSLANNPAMRAVLFAGSVEELQALAVNLAERKGPIVPIYLANDRLYPAAFLVEEQVTCINTTAAGGNASLMMIG